MSVPRRVRTACIAAGVTAVLVGAASGITYAATTAAPKPAGTYAAACTNSSDALRVVSSGKCPKGDTQIKLATAPTPLAVSGSVTPSHSRRKNATVGDFTFVASCSEDATSAHSFAHLTVNSTAGFDVQGSEVFTGNDAASFSTSQQTSYAEGAGQITYAAPVSDPTFVLTLSEDGGVTGNAILVQAGHTVTVTFAFFAFPANCSVQAQIASSS